MTADRAADEAPADRVRSLVGQLLTELDPKTTPPAEFLGRQYDLGLAWVHFPERHGGLGLEPGLQQHVGHVLQAAGAPQATWRNPIGCGMAAPTLLAFASPEDLDRYLRPLFTGEELWCQLFSEPGAGSDVAGLATRAVRDGAEWVVNGQKVWTSLGHQAKWGLLLARTEPDVPKHKGLTYFVIDMKGEGVQTRPLVQMTGGAEFNEVYFTDARVPDSRRLGDVGDGWRVAITTLMNERVAIGGAVPLRGEGAIGAALAAYKRRGVDDPALRDELMHLWVAAEVARLTNVRSSQTRAAGTPGPDGSIGKMVSAELNKKIWALVMNLMGMAGTLYPDGYRTGSGDDAGVMNYGPHKQFVRSVATSIEGGTTEIMRNILAERVLGMPGDVRVDKDVPWSEVPRS